MNCKDCGREFCDRNTSLQDEVECNRLAIRRLRAANTSLSDERVRLSLENVHLKDDVSRITERACQSTKAALNGIAAANALIAKLRGKNAPLWNALAAAQKAAHPGCMSCEGLPFGGGGQRNECVIITAAAEALGMPRPEVLARIRAIQEAARPAHDPASCPDCGGAAGPAKDDR